MINFVLYFCISLNHVVLNNEYSKSIVKKFKPQHMDGKIVSTIGVNKYVKTKLLFFNNEIDRKSIVQLTNNNELNLLVFSITEEHDFFIELLLWTPGTNKKKCLKCYMNYLHELNVKKIKLSNDLENDEKRFFK